MDNFYNTAVFDISRMQVSNNNENKLLKEHLLRVPDKIRVDLKEMEFPLFSPFFNFKNILKGGRGFYRSNLIQIFFF